MKHLGKYSRFRKFFLLSKSTIKAQNCSSYFAVVAWESKKMSQISLSLSFLLQFLTGSSLNLKLPPIFFKERGGEKKRVRFLQWRRGAVEKAGRRKSVTLTSQVGMSEIKCVWGGGGGGGGGGRGRGGEGGGRRRRKKEKGMTQIFLLRQSSSKKK